MTHRRLLKILLALTVVLTACKPIELSQSSLTLKVSPRHKIEQLVLKNFDIAAGESVGETQINSGLQNATTFLDNDTYCDILSSFGDDIPRTAEQEIEVDRICNTTKSELYEISLVSLMNDTTIRLHRYEPNEMVEGSIEKGQTLTDLLKPHTFYEIHVGLEGIRLEKNTIYILQYWTDDKGKPAYRNWFTQNTTEQGKPQSVENL